MLPEGFTVRAQGATLVVRPESEECKLDALAGLGANGVSDLTIVIDAVKPGANAKRNGVSFRGGGANRVHNVSVQGVYGSKRDGHEAFGIVAFGGEITKSSVGDCRGGYVSGICGPAKKIEECFVVMPRAEPGDVYLCFNLQDADGLVLNRCQAFGGRSSVYSDWKTTNNITISHGRFIGATYGLHLNAQELERQTESRVIRGVDMHGCDIRSRAAAVLLDHTEHPYDPQPRQTGRNLIQNVKMWGNEVGAWGSKPNDCWALNVATRYNGTDQSVGIRGVQWYGNYHEPGMIFRNWMRLAQVDVAVPREPNWME